MKTEFKIMTRSPKLKGAARKYGSSYAKFALVEYAPDLLPEGRMEPSMISPRARGMVRIIDCKTVYCGEMIRSEGQHYLRRLERLKTKCRAQQLCPGEICLPRNLVHNVMQFINDRAEETRGRRRTESRDLLRRIRSEIV